MPDLSRRRGHRQPAFNPQEPGTLSEQAHDRPGASDDFHKGVSAGKLIPCPPGGSTLLSAEQIVDDVAFWGGSHGPGAGPRDGRLAMART